MRGQLSIFALLSVSSLSLVACEPRQDPGESVGVFQIVGSLEDNGCGAAIPAIDPLAFEAELRDDLGRGVWVIDDQPIRTGLRLPDGAYRFRNGATVPVLAPQPEIGYRGCDLQQVELVEVRVSTPPVGDDEAADGSATGDAGEIALEINGINEILFTPTATSDCSPLPVVNGGPWAALPCTVRYTLFGDGTGPDPDALDPDAGVAETANP